MNPKEHLMHHLGESSRCVSKMASDPELIALLSEIANECVKRLNSGNKLLFAGNGGSAADCQHMAGEYVGKFLFERQGLAAIALTTDSSILTAVGNDYGYETLFSRQIEALGRSGDLLFAYSTSGNSKNIIKAVETAAKMGICVVGMTGMNEGKLDAMCDFLFKTPSIQTPQIQEGHLIAGHSICAIVEQLILDSQEKNKFD